MASACIEVAHEHCCCCCCNPQDVRSLLSAAAPRASGTLLCHVCRLHTSLCCCRCCYLSGSYFALSLFDKMWHPDLTLDEAVAMMEVCLCCLQGLCWCVFRHLWAARVADIRLASTAWQCHAVALSPTACTCPAAFSIRAANWWHTGRFDKHSSMLAYAVCLTDALWGIA